MKFLHTADWHLGVKTNGKDRFIEQKQVIDEIISIANHENIDCVLIAGDVFNSASPSADAEELFFESIERLSNNGERFVFVLAGNHDDPTRLSAGLPLASKHNIALAGEFAKLNDKSFNKNSSIQVVETGKGHIKIQKNEEIVTIAYLPYPSESRIDTKVDSDLSYPEKVKAWAEIATSAFNDDSFNIFVSHMFLVGAKTNDSVVKVGDILAVPKNLLPVAGYTALGHIHTAQDLGDNMYYSGAITKLTVGQKDMSVNVFETENCKLTSLKQIKLQNVAKYEKLTVNSIEEAEEKLLNFDDGDIVELEIIQNEPLSSSSLKLLKKQFACLSNISLLKVAQNKDVKVAQKRKMLSDSELFKQFYLQNRGFEPSEDLLKMFIECKGGSDETD